MNEPYSRVTNDNGLANGFFGGLAVGGALGALGGAGYAGRQHYNDRATQRQILDAHIGYRNDRKEMPDPKDFRREIMETPEYKSNHEMFREIDGKYKNKSSVAKTYGKTSVIPGLIGASLGATIGIVADAANNR